MKIDPKIAATQSDMTSWRRDMHAHPELGFQEQRTAAKIAALLKEFGCDVTTGLAKTGVVGTIRVGNSPRAIGLRADIDCLPMEELNGFDHRSTHKGRMHACGHDGHTAMLLGAAKYLAATRNFEGAVHFIFQPAEEGGGGGRVMVEEGLFSKFPVDAVFGMHNRPGLDVGKFQIRSGPMLAGACRFDINITGKGGHAARPENNIDSVLLGAHMLTALQSVRSRTLSPHEPAVISVTQFHAGDAYNVIPETAVLRGTARAFRTKTMDAIKEGMRRVASGSAATFGAKAECVFYDGYPPLVNHEQETGFIADIAASIVGEDNVDRNGPLVMGSEDFSYMLQARPGAYIFIGNGPSTSLHSDTYDFNDDAIPLGVSYWAKLVETALPVAP